MNPLRIRWVRVLLGLPLVSEQEHQRAYREAYRKTFPDAKKPPTPEGEGHHQLATF